MLQGYGMTETAPVVAVNGLDDNHPASVGRALPGVEVRIGDNRELQVRGPWIASSYYKPESKEGNAAFTADGWFGTGDVARVDEHGYMEITDRKKDLIKTRGEWLSSVEMENAAMAFPGIAEAAVVGRPDEVRGEAAVLFIVPLPEKKDDLDLKALHAFLGEKFAHWQVPKTSDIRIIEAIPKTSVGKFDKKVLRTRI